MKNNKGTMSRIIIAGLFTLIVVLSGCTADNNQKTTPANTTEFGQMLDTMPYSFLESADIYYGNFALSKEINNAEDVKSLEEFNKMTQDDRDKYIKAWNDTAGFMPDWNTQAQSGGSQSLASLTGFDVFSFNYALLSANGPARRIWVTRGELDAELIKSSLEKLGYIKTDYAGVSYFSKGDDFQIDMENPLSRLFLAGMNRIAVLDDILVTAPATEYITEALDAITNIVPSVLDNAACQALADSTGDVLTAVITTPERIVSSITKEQGRPDFNFTIPQDWGELRGYTAAVISCRADGEERYFDIALYYDSKNDAEADGNSIVTRMESYNLHTNMTKKEPVPYTSLMESGNPDIKQYGDGAVLKISCRIIPGDDKVSLLWLMGAGGMPVRDLLFLAPNPQDYIKQLNQ